MFGSTEQKSTKVTKQFEFTCPKAAWNSCIEQQEIDGNFAFITSIKNVVINLCNQTHRTPGTSLFQSTIPLKQTILTSMSSRKRKSGKSGRDNTVFPRTMMLFSDGAFSSQSTPATRAFINYSTIASQATRRPLPSPKKDAL